MTSSETVTGAVNFDRLNVTRKTSELFSPDRRLSCFSDSSSGIRIKKQIDEVRIANAGLATKKSQLTSIPAILKAIKDGVIKLVPIEDRFIVRVGIVRRGVVAADSQPAAGRGR